MPAWRDRSGIIHVISPEDGLVERSLADFFGVQDAHSVFIHTGAKPSRYAWVILQDGGLEVPQEIQELIRQLPASFSRASSTPFLSFPHSRWNDRLGKLFRSSFGLSKVSGCRQSADSVNWQPLLLLHRTPNAPTLFLIHDLEGSPQKYRELVALLSDDWTLIGTTARGLQAPDACHQTVESEAGALVEAMRTQDPDGPYHLFGYGFGAVLAFEMAHQLRAAGCRVRYLALSGSRAPSLNGKADDWMRSLSRAFSRAGKREVAIESPPASVEHSHVHALRVSHLAVGWSLLRDYGDQHGTRS
jgi:hypothetical protein